MKRDYTRAVRRMVGMRLHPRAEMLTDLATAFQNYVDERVNDPRKVERELDQMGRDNMEEVRKANRAATHAAADEGRRLLQQKSRHGGGAGWRAHLARQHYTPRTAYHRVALHVFRDANPELFDRFASLGKTKCMRLALLPKEVLIRMHPQMPVWIGEEHKPLEYLTDEQLIEYIKVLCPVQHRPRRKVLKYALRSAERAVSPALHTDTLAREDAEEARDATQRVLNRLNEMLKAG